MKALHPILLFLIILTLSCSKEGSNPISESEDKSTVIQLIEQKQSANELVVNLSETQDNYELYYELGDTIKLDKSCVQSAFIDATEWQCYIYLDDSSLVQVDALGDILAIPTAAIRINPFGKSPLCSIVDLELPIPCNVEHRVIGQDGPESDFRRVYQDFSKSHELGILGLYPDYENEVEITLKDKHGNFRFTRTIKLITAPLVRPFEVQVLENKLPIDDNDVYLDANTMVAFDKFGKVRWDFNGLALLFRVTSDGYLLNGVLGDESYVRKLDFFGRTVMEMPINSIMHHDVREMPNGNFLCAVNTEDGYQDLVWEIDGTSGEVLNSFDMGEILDQDRYHALGANDDWIHLNSLFYDEKDGSLMISSRHQNAVVKIDMQTKEIIWIMGSHEHWNEAFHQYLLTPLNFTEEEWNWGQHAAMILPNRNLFIFNNGNFRSYNQSAVQETYSNAVEYKIDETNMTVSLEHEFGKDKNLYCGSRGDVDYLPVKKQKVIGYTVKNYNAETPRVIVLDNNNELLFEAIYDLDKDHYRIEKISLDL